VIYLDYKKAFDSVPHRRLIEKLKGYGINGHLLEWITSFLTSRTMRVGVKGSFSEWIEVLSGVPQGSVLGPLLFLLFVNELPDWIVNSMRMFADDTKLWAEIRSESDNNSLQKDLDELSSWSRKWLFKFNPLKCKIMRIGHRLDTRYFMTDVSGRNELQTVKAEKDLGVFCTDDLKPSTQCIKAAGKARSVLAMVHRSFRRLDPEDFLLIYKTYIRPHLEFCVQAWSPHLSKDIQCIERVQRAATRLVPQLKYLSYEGRLDRLGLTTLERRRSRGDLIETYKLMTGKEKVFREQFFQIASNGHNTRGHSLKIAKQRTHLDLRKYFFSQRVVNEWNSLPQHVVDAPSTNSFKGRLDRYQKDMSNKGSAY